MPKQAQLRSERFVTKLKHELQGYVYNLYVEGGYGDGLMFYIGSTRDPNRRYKEHLNLKCLSTSSYIKLLKIEGATFKLKVITKYKTYKQAEREEQKLIKASKGDPFLRNFKEVYKADLDKIFDLNQFNY